MWYYYTMLNINFTCIFIRVYRNIKISYRDLHMDSFNIVTIETVSRCTFLYLIYEKHGELKIGTLWEWHVNTNITSPYVKESCLTIPLVVVNHKSKVWFFKKRQYWRRIKFYCHIKNNKTDDTSTFGVVTGFIIEEYKTQTKDP